ncbi:MULTISPECIES: LPS export ABC transporter periplasmic protein LptC [unclassified Spirosoma]|uniref:LPS export ABC transporter periplasmic protein LptC n=2 Tax=Spirosoma TaxID=107 RepID=UPI000B121DCA|nr:MULTISPECIES: LPS export ABC transporter periplasmic protein LptC [unclassified Spirosoma]MBN8821191.1 LPS export ABC transporter periplasmic protein LptC [Spirosoma sp.]
MSNAQCKRYNEQGIVRFGRLAKAGGYLVFIIHCTFFLMACGDPKQAKKVEPYSGPIEEINDVKLLYSEAAMLKVKLTTAKQLRYVNDNRRYPKPIQIVFYGPSGDEVTTVRSDSGRYDKAKDIYVVIGHVEVLNKQKQEKLLTPELTWNPITKKVYTDKPVTILSQLTGEKLYGIGLDANQDFTKYAIRKVTGVFNVDAGI